MNKTTFTGKLIIFTSFYDQRGHAPYINSLVQTTALLSALGIKWDYWLSHGDFHIERALNETYTRFLNDPEATDLLCIDSDESWDPMGVLRLIAHPEEIVGGSYRMKNKWDTWTALLKTDENGVPKGKILGDGTALIEAERLPWGFLRIKKSVIEKYRDHFPNLKFQARDGEEHIIVCQQQYRDGVFFSQDYVFSERLKEMGYRLWCDPNITITHYGTSANEGNLDTHLKGLKTEQAAFKVIEQMAADIEARKAA